MKTRIRQLRLAPHRRSALGPAAFTLVEMLVVLAVIALLVQILVPSIRRSIQQAQSTVCKSNLHGLGLALRMYADENSGALPFGTDTSVLTAGRAWQSVLFNNDREGMGALICPTDPWASVLRSSLQSPGADVSGSFSYGLNDFVMSSPLGYLANLDRNRPARPADTILLADMGPDTIGRTAGGDNQGLEVPSRNAGRLAIDDGYVPGSLPDQQSAPWLTGRHLGRINVLTWAGGIKDVNVLPTLFRPVDDYYSQCAAQSCTLCLDLEIDHYSFAESQAFWWTGSLPIGQLSR